MTSRSIARRPLLWLLIGALTITTSAVVFYSAHQRNPGTPQLHALPNLSGRVRDVNQRGIPDVMVRLFTCKGSSECVLAGLGYTDQAGAYRVAVSRGIYKVQFAPNPEAGYSDSWWQTAQSAADALDISIKDSSVINATLIKLRSLTGTVLDAKTSIPVANVRLVAYQVGPKPCCDPGTMAISDAAGRFKFGLPDGIYHIYLFLLTDDYAVDTWWQDATTFDQAKDVEVGATTPLTITITPRS